MKFCKSLLTLALGIIALSTQAAMISILPADQTVNLGDQATVDVVVSGLDNEYVGDYDFNIIWDSTLLSLDSVVFDNYLDDGAGLSLQDAVNITGGVNIAEVSLGSLLNQTGYNEFRLFNMTFDTLSTGTSQLDFEGNIGNNLDAYLGDGLGGLLETSVNSGSITIVQTSSVPEPSTILIMATGLILLGLSRKKSMSA